MARTTTRPVDNGIAANQQNDYYASISSDPLYEQPESKQTVRITNTSPLNTWQVFNTLDKLRPTATGLDKLPAWYLRVGAPFFAEPLTKLFNQALEASFIPQQWHTACIVPIPKITIIMYALDFTKAFDTVRHKTLLDKVAALAIPDNIYNWIVEFFRYHSHCTRHNLTNYHSQCISNSRIGARSGHIHRQCGRHDHPVKR